MPFARADEDREPERAGHRDQLVEEQALAPVGEQDQQQQEERPDDQQVVRDLPEPPGEVPQLRHEVGGRRVGRRRAGRIGGERDTAQHREHEQDAVGGSTRPLGVGSRREHPERGESAAPTGLRSVGRLVALRSASWLALPSSGTSVPVISFPPIECIAQAEPSRRRRERRTRARRQHVRPAAPDEPADPSAILSQHHARRMLRRRRRARHRRTMSPMPARRRRTRTDPRCSSPRWASRSRRLTRRAPSAVPMIRPVGTSTRTRTSPISMSQAVNHHSPAFTTSATSKNDPVATPPCTLLWMPPRSAREPSIASSQMSSAPVRGRTGSGTSPHADVDAPAGRS